jgi:metal-sulfur cluster biosynthetic enzyme
LSKVADLKITGTDVSAVMTMTGVPACDRMDVNVAQMEELILENHWVDI